MKKPTGPHITGFFLGGVFGLDDVGHVMARMFERGVQRPESAPVWPAELNPELAKLPKRGHLALPAPSGGERQSATSIIMEVVKQNGGNVKRETIVDELQKHGHPKANANSTLARLLQHGSIRRVDYGLYTLGDKPWPPKSTEPVAATRPVRPGTVTDATLKVLAKIRGPIKRPEVISRVQETHPSADPAAVQYGIKEALKQGIIKRVPGSNRNGYEPAGYVPPEAKAGGAWGGARRKRGTITGRQIQMDYLQQHQDRPVTVKELRNEYQRHGMKPTSYSSILHDLINKGIVRQLGIGTVQLAPEKRLRAKPEPQAAHQPQAQEKRA